MPRNSYPLDTMVGFFYSPFDGTSVRLIVIKVFSFDSRYGPGCAESEIYGDTGA